MLTEPPREVEYSQMLWYGDRLKVICASTDRLSALKAMNGHQRSVLAYSCALWALRRCVAMANPPADAAAALFGRVNKDPELSEATRIINRAFVQVENIPAWPFDLAFRMPIDTDAQASIFDEALEGCPR